MRRRRSGQANQPSAGLETGAASSRFAGCPGGAGQARGAGAEYLDWVGRDLVNNWDLVDTSAEHLVGAWLLVPLAGAQGLPCRISDLITSSNVWERRVAVMSTFATTRAGTDWPTYAVARQLLDDPHDLIHKAVGWMLREAGKRVDEASLVAFLDQYAAHMPRTMLRYAIERLTPEARAHYRSLRA